MSAAEPAPSVEQAEPTEPTEPVRRRAFWRGWCRGTWVMLTLDTLWLALVVARPLLSGRLAWWSVLDAFPPIALLAVPFLMVVQIPVLRLIRIRLPGSARWVLAGLAAVALAVGFPQAGLNLAALGSPPPPAPAGALRVTVWDSLGWDTGKDSASFYAYLEKQNSDIYVLQEYIGIAGDGAAYPIHDEAALRARFPGYSVSTNGELLTLSRYPVLDQRVIGGGRMPAALDGIWTYGDTRILRTDLAVGGRVLSVYNVHLPDLFNFGPSELSPAFYEQASEMAGWRNAEMAALQSDLAGNRHQVLVGGDLNLVPGSAALGRLGALQDATRASRSLYPVSFWAGRLDAWHMDWTFASADATVYRYDLADPQGLSTHRAQNVVLTYPAS